MAARKKRSRIVTGLDIGTTKVCAIIGQADEEGQLTVLGVGSHPSQGLKKGMVVDIDLTVDSIQKAVRKAEQMAGVTVRDVYVGIAGGHIRSMNSKGIVEVQNPVRGVTEQDRQRAMDRARKSVIVAEDVEVLHIIPQEYVVDGQPGIKNPIGMSCSSLEVRTHVVLAAMTSASNIMRCISHAGLRTCEILLESLASSLAILNDTEKDLGVVLVDIGGGTSDVGIFAGGSVKYSGVVPLGGDSLTNDISYGLRVSKFEAENIKKKYGCATASLINGDDTIEVTDALKNAPTAVDRRFLAEITEARLEQIFEMVKQMIDTSRLGDRIHGGIVLTGGTSLMGGIVELAERVFEMRAKVGMPEGIKGLSGVVNSPIYSTGIGLVMYGLSEQAVNPAYYANGSILRKLSFRFRKMLEWYLFE